VTLLRKGKSSALIERLTAKEHLLTGDLDLEEVLGFMPTPKSKEVHVLVVLPKGAIIGVERIRVSEMFLEQSFSELKKGKRKRDKNQPVQTIRYFTMDKFPPLAHAMEDYTKIVERYAYTVLFDNLMSHAMSCFDSKRKPSANLVVTGNPGIGKSRFYLYCIFRILNEQQEKLKAMSSFVLNYDGKYHRYDASTREFILLNDKEVSKLSEQERVLRLIDGKSTLLVGWRGVSILFTSPGLTEIRDYCKNKSTTYIMPTWSLEELQNCNQLLQDDLKLSEIDLISRCSKHGGIPRFIFTTHEIENNNDLNGAIRTFDSLKIINITKESQPVRSNEYSHRVLEMVPDNVNFHSSYHLDFLSNSIAEKVVAKLNEDSLRKISEFAIAHSNDDTGNTSVIRGRIYEMLCHKWFNLNREKNVQLRLLGSNEHTDLLIPGNMPMVPFSTLDTIRDFPRGMTYYRPMSRTFGAVDALILDVENTRCYGLQMTINENHGIKAAPLNSLVNWLDDSGIKIENFYFCFVVPSSLSTKYKTQRIITQKNEIHLRPGKTTKVKQYVIKLDVFKDVFT
jgi:hypothetical protein